MEHPNTGIPGESFLNGADLAGGSGIETTGGRIKGAGMTKRDTDKIYRRRRGSPALLALIVLLVLTAASALIALAW